MFPLRLVEWEIVTPFLCQNGLSHKYNPFPTSAFALRYSQASVALGYPYMIYLDTPAEDNCPEYWDIIVLIIWHMKMVMARTYFIYIISLYTVVSISLFPVDTLHASVSSNV
jgi:hypothetical protein